MTLRDETERARFLLGEAKAMLDLDADNVEWADGFGARVAAAVTTLSDAGVHPSPEGSISVPADTEALREALTRADELLELAGTEAATWEIDVRQFDDNAPAIGAAKRAQQAYDLCNAIIEAGLRIGGSI
jgi:hypothetical protein